jgi:hypothetical protein
VHEVGVLMVCWSVDGVLLNHFLLLLCFSMPCEVEDS